MSCRNSIYRKLTAYVNKNIYVGCPIYDGRGIYNGFIPYTVFYNDGVEVIKQYVEKAPVLIDQSQGGGLISSPISYPNSFTDLFEIECEGVTVSNGDRYFELWDSSDVTTYLIAYNFTGDTFVVAIYLSGVPYIAAFGTYNPLLKQKLGFSISGTVDNMVLRSTINGVESTNFKTLDMTGVKFDRMVIGNRRALTSTATIKLWGIESILLSQLSFISNNLSTICYSNGSIIVSANTPVINNGRIPDYQAEKTDLNYYYAEGVANFDGSTYGFNSTSNNSISFKTIGAGASIQFEPETRSDVVPIWFVHDAVKNGGIKFEQRDNDYFSVVIYSNDGVNRGFAIIPPPSTPVCSITTIIVDVDAAFFNVEIYLNSAYAATILNIPKSGTYDTSYNTIAEVGSNQFSGKIHSIRTFINAVIYSEFILYGRLKTIGENQTLIPDSSGMSLANIVLNKQSAIFPYLTGSAIYRIGEVAE